jgi:putative transposase
MPSTHSSLQHHFVFSTKNRAPSIAPEWQRRLHKYLGGIIRSTGGLPLVVGGVPDHVHLLVTLKPVHRLSDVLRDLKRSSSMWVHEEIGERKCAWQEGYGAFTVSRSNIPTVKSYVEHQEEHHRKRTFQEEYRELLRKHGVEFDERYLL